VPPLPAHPAPPPHPLSVSPGIRGVRSVSPGQPGETSHFPRIPGETPSAWGLGDDDAVGARGADRGADRLFEEPERAHLAGVIAMRDA